jgi:hypothetical protein
MLEKVSGDAVSPDIDQLIRRRRRASEVLELTTCEREPFVFVATVIEQADRQTGKGTSRINKEWRMFHIMR